MYIIKVKHNTTGNRLIMTIGSDEAYKQAMYDLANNNTTVHDISEYTLTVSKQ